MVKRLESVRMIKLNEIKMSFNDEPVLTNVSLELNEADVIHIKGANGSGKSTLLKIIAELLIPHSGKVEYNQDVNIGALIENPTFVENETALFNLKFLANLKGNYDEKEVTSLLELFGLDPSSRKIMKKYSLGMRQKVGIIQAVMENQNVILFDEPTRGLDENSIKVFTDIVEKKRLERKTILICSHDNIEAINYTRKLVLKNGQLYPILPQE